MSVIIRLQNLPWSANALDIRQYFQGLSIPEGGVHIVGGELGDAFIAFSTDEDARQAFNRNNGKIREVQITLMLSSRTEMQRVIEAARAKSYAAFMQPAPSPVVPLPAAVPPIIPAAVPEIKREVKESKRDGRRRSRSKSRDRESRDRKDRSRDRKDKRYRDRSRSRSRSRDRKERRRRDRSRSRGRSRSRERDRRSSRSIKRSEERTTVPNFQQQRKQLPEVWANPNQTKSPSSIIPLAPQAPSILGNFPVNLDQAKLTLNTLTGGLQANGFPSNNGGNFNPGGGRNSRESWPPVANQNHQNFRSGDNFQNSRQKNMGPGSQDDFQVRFQRNHPQRDGPRNRMDNDFVDCSVAVEPYYGGYGEIRRFFQGLFISHKSIKFINDSNGRRTGLVYIQFGNRKIKEQALTLNGDTLNGISVSITHLDDRDFEEAVDRYPLVIVGGNSDDNGSEGSYKHRGKHMSKYFHNPVPQEPEIKDFCCLIVEDLPTYCKEQDILHIFSQHPLVALILTSKPSPRAAYVKFSSKDGARQAYEEKSHHFIGGKQVTVRPCKDEEFEEINKQHEVDLTSPKIADIGTHCLSISRLPMKTSDKDIADFFSDIGVIPEKIHLMSNNMGFTGQAYCEFLTTEEATRAAKKNDTVLGKTHISVIPIKKEDMMSILGHTTPTPTPVEPVKPQIAAIKQPAVPSPITVDPPVTLPKAESPNPLNADPSPNPMGHNPNLIHGNNPPVNPGHMPRPPFFNNRNFDNNGRNFDNSGRNFDNGPPRGGPRFGGHRGMGPGPRGRFGGPPPDQFDDCPPRPGCTIYMKNIPYRATTNDILDFFEGYHTTNSVNRRYNPNNTPTDEAKVVFYDADEAFRAVQELQKEKIWERQIFLRQE